MKDAAYCQHAAVPDRHGSVRRRASSQSQAQESRSRCPADAGEIRSPYSKGQKNDFRDGEAIAEAVQRPAMRFVATKTVEQLDLQALHRVRERLVGQCTGIINQIRAFLLERGIAVRQGLRFLRIELPGILAKRTGVLSPRMLHIIEGLADDWHRLDERIEALSSEIAELAGGDPACDRLMTVPGIGPIISSAMVAAIGNGAAFSKGRDFGAWLGLVPKQILGG
jgi:transposase